MEMVLLDVSGLCLKFSGLNQFSGRNLPLGLLAFLLAMFSLNIEAAAAVPERQLAFKMKLKNLDIIGMTLLFGFVACLCIALQDGGTRVSWSASRTIGLLVGFGILKILFWITQYRLGEDALIPVRFLRQRTVAFGSLFLFLDNMSNYVVSLLNNIQKVSARLRNGVLETILSPILFPSNVGDTSITKWG